jgi:hypothetical protein
MCAHAFQGFSVDKNNVFEIDGKALRFVGLYAVILLHAQYN